MAKMGISEAFATYGATLRNVNWSVSAWTPDDELVVSLWAHHYRRGPDKSVEFAHVVGRWQGPGRNEFCTNVQRAKDHGSQVRLVIVTALNPEQLDTSDNATEVKKDFHVRPDLVGHVAEFDGDSYVFRFVKAAA